MRFQPYLLNREQSRTMQKKIRRIREGN